jgi:predicted TIM-barrel fold metal-dependent hydrolase
MLFATDYPHWDADDAEYVASQLPPAWHEKVFYQNALDFYGWKESDLTADRARALA